MDPQRLSEMQYSGFLNLDKPSNLTSHDVVAKVRRRYRALTGLKKVGHAGTLDPLATGVLVLCLGKATRLSEYIMRGAKTYRAHVTLGVSTSTYDAAGDILHRCETGHIQLSDVKSHLRQFIGDLQQIPPMYSAVKVGGRKLYELARQNQEIEREPRPVRIDAIDILDWDNPSLKLEIRCSAGTYIRSLAHDLGLSLGVGAHLSALCRTASGNFTLDDSITLEQVLEDDAWLEAIVPPHTALADQCCVTLSESEVAMICHGRAIPRHYPAVAAPIFAFAQDRQLVAVLEQDAELWKPRKVFCD